MLFSLKSRMILEQSSFVIVLGIVENWTSPSGPFKAREKAFRRGVWKVSNKWQNFKEEGKITPVAPGTIFALSETKAGGSWKLALNKIPSNFVIVEGREQKIDPYPKIIEREINFGGNMDIFSAMFLWMESEVREGQERSESGRI